MWTWTQLVIFEALFYLNFTLFDSLVPREREREYGRRRGKIRDCPRQHFVRSKMRSMIRMVLLHLYTLAVISEVVRRVSCLYTNKFNEVFYFFSKGIE